MSLTTKDAILKTLAYANVFNFPLTPKEIHHWLVGKKASSEEVQAELNKLKLPQKNFTDRKLKAKIAVKKWAIAQKTSHLLSKIPTVLSVLVTGNLSMNNSTDEDDIDLLIITQKNTLWTTRFSANIILDILKIRRHPFDKEYKDKICLNMFLDESHLLLPPKDRNIYTAHELLQSKPLFDKPHTFLKFLKLNSWTKTYLPNAYFQKLKTVPRSKYKENLIESLLTQLLQRLETPLAFLQKKYMQKKITNEIIEDGVVRFHPKNTKDQILKKYNSRLKFLLTNPHFLAKIAVGKKE